MMAHHFEPRPPPDPKTEPPPERVARTAGIGRTVSTIESYNIAADIGNCGCLTFFSSAPEARRAILMEAAR